MRAALVEGRHRRGRVDAFHRPRARAKTVAVGERPKADRGSATEVRKRTARGWPVCRRRAAMSAAKTPATALPPRDRGKSGAAFARRRAGKWTPERQDQSTDRLIGNGPRTGWSLGLLARRASPKGHRTST